MTLRTRLLLWNGAFFLVALSLFGAVLIYTGVRSAENMLDNMLLRRSEEMSRRPNRPGGPGGPGGPDGPRFGQGGPPEGRPRGDGRGPRFFDLQGHSIAPEPNLAPWSKELYERSLKGETAFGSITDENGVRLRILSRPIQRPDGAREIMQIAQESDALRLARDGQVWAFVVALPFLLLASVGLAGVLARFVLLPVRQLTQTAERIAENPRHREPLSTEGDDEIARLTQALQGMTDQLQSSNEQLEAALDQQRRFTSDAAHELRTPLSSIALAAENGLHAKSTPEEMRRSLEIVSRGSSSMNKLTNVLLSLARMDSGQRLEVSAHTLGAIVAEAVHEAGLEGDPRLEVALDETAVQVNPDAMRQVVRNLLENAAAYAPAGKITVRQAGTSLMISDTGEGIAAEHLPHLFERFYRADPARTRAKGGHGLGLAIVKALVEAQGGQVTVQSQLGSGTFFKIEFKA